MARYYYDAWGNCKVEQYNDSNDIGNINPFRWKGHYFDAESGLYYANGSYYDPEVGLHLDAMPISAAIENAFEAFGLDLNGLMCDNVLAYLPYVYSAFTTMELTADPGYDLNANKPWWELAWNAIKSWFVSVVQWYNGLSNNTKTIIGIAFFALACAITAVVTYLTGGGGTGIITALWDMTVKFAIGVVTAAAISGVIALCSGGDIAEAITSAAADAILIGGIIAFVSAGVNAVKTGVRSVRNAKLAGSSQTGAQAQSSVNHGTQKYRPANRGQSSTGRRTPYNLQEKLAMEQAMSNPLAGKQLPVKMTDARWLGTEGWVKMQQTFEFYNGSKTTIHYVMNDALQLVDDFKFVYPR